MPGEITDRLSKAVVKVLAAPELREQLLKTGFAVSGTGSAELKKLTAGKLPSGAMSSPKQS